MKTAHQNLLLWTSNNMVKHFPSMAHEIPPNIFKKTVKIQSKLPS